MTTNPLAASMTEPKASAAQHRLMHVLWREAGVTDRDDRLRRTSRMLGRTVESSAQLSKTEAHKIIDLLDLL
jgi:hypothetical protein